MAATDGRVVRLIVRVTRPVPFVPAVVQCNVPVGEGEEPRVGGRVRITLEGEIQAVVPAPLPG